MKFRIFTLNVGCALFLTTQVNAEPKQELTADSYLLMSAVVHDSAGLNLDVQMEYDRGNQQIQLQVGDEIVVVRKIDFNVGLTSFEGDLNREAVVLFDDPNHLLPIIASGGSDWILQIGNRRLVGNASRHGSLASDAAVKLDYKILIKTATPLDTFPDTIAGFELVKEKCEVISQPRNTYLLVVRSTESISAILATLQATPGVLIAQANQIYKPLPRIGGSN